MPRIKNQILSKLKEYASKMGTNTMGGDDYTSKKKGGLRDFDGYDNVDYNKDMPMDEAKDMTLSDYIKILDKKIEDAQKAVTGKNGSKEEYSNRGDILQNFKSRLAQRRNRVADNANGCQVEVADHGHKSRAKRHGIRTVPLLWLVAR